MSGSPVIKLEVHGPEHGIASAFYDNLGNGWRIECVCGFMTTPNAKMQDTGAEFDEHLTDVEMEMGR